jgi:hypothetical protein
MRSVLNEYLHNIQNGGRLAGISGENERICELLISVYFVANKELLCARSNGPRGCRIGAYCATMFLDPAKMSRHYGYTATERNWECLCICKKAGACNLPRYYSVAFFFFFFSGVSRPLFFYSNRVPSMFYNNQLTETKQKGLERCEVVAHEVRKGK